MASTALEPHHCPFRFQVCLLLSWSTENEAVGNMKLFNNRSGSRGLPVLSRDFTGRPVYVRTLSSRRCAEVMRKPRPLAVNNVVDGPFRSQGHDQRLERSGPRPFPTPRPYHTIPYHDQWLERSGDGRHSKIYFGCLWPTIFFSKLRLDQLVVYHVADRQNKDYGRTLTTVDPHQGC